MEEFKKLILGEVSVAYYAAAEFFAILAIILSLYLSSRQRNPMSANTPERFSWPFLVWDNVKRIVVGQILLFLIFRFTTELLGRELNMFWATGIGFFVSLGLDQAIAMLKQKTTLFDVNREKLMSNMVPPPNGGK